MIESKTHFLKKGFTLVELSIVLVIIGLLIGGILVAQSMISTAKIQALVRQVGQFDAAVENFQTKYGQLPGDTNLMGITPGDNDGVITSLHNQYFQAEVAKFWADLSNSGLTKPNGGKYLDASLGAYADSTYLPKSAAGINSNVLAVGSPISRNNYYVFVDVTKTTYQLDPLAGSFLTSEIVAVDNKMDDGSPTSGNVQPWGYWDYFKLLYNDGSSVDRLEQTESTCSPGPAHIYLISDTTDLCAIRIRMGISAGNPK